MLKFQTLISTRGLAIVGLTALLSSGLAGCRSKISASAKRSDAVEPTAEPEATETPNPAAEQSKEPAHIDSGIEEARLYYQSRSVITLKLSSDFVAPGATFTLVNESNGKTLVENATSGLSLTESDTPYQLLSDQLGYEVIVKLYPLDPSLLGKFIYGANKIRVMTEEQAQEQFDDLTITLQDFDIQGPSAIAASDQDDAIDMWTNESSRPVVAADGSTLTTNMQVMIND